MINIETNKNMQKKELIEMKDFLILWANTSTVRHINYHFTQLGEIVDYLEKIPRRN